MSILKYQRQRIAAALTSLLRAASGRGISRAELNSRVNTYLSNTEPRGLGPTDPVPNTAPLFRASDYAPTSANDLLGGKDGRDIARVASAVREDLDTVNEVVSEAERRITQVRALLHNHNATLQQRAQNDTDNGAAIASQLQALFFGGSSGAAAGGYGRTVWTVTPSSDLVYPETTGVLLDTGIASLGAQGQAANEGTPGSTLSQLSVVGSSDPSVLASSAAQTFVTQPISGGAGWTFSQTGTTPVTLTIKANATDTVGAFEITCSAGTLVTKVSTAGTPIPFQTVTGAGTIWVVPTSPVSGGVPVQFTFTGVPSSTTDATQPNIGTIVSIKAHVFSFDAQDSLVFGPYTSQAEGGGDLLLTMTLEALDAAIPVGSDIQVQASTVSADGPWISLPNVGSTVALSSAGSSDYDLLATEAQPDPQSQGYYVFPFTAVGSGMGAEFSAGQGQAQVAAYSFNWTFAGEVGHVVSPTDWSNPQGTPRTVAMGSGPLVQGQNDVQAFAPGSYVSQGTCLSRYQDDQGADLTVIALRDQDNSFVCQQAYNYQFNFALYTPAATALTDVPVGIFNPNGGAGLYGVPFLVQLNGQQIYQGYGTFSDYTELSPQNTGFGLSPSDYHVGQLQGSRGYQGTGAWPPYCGRMNLILTPGWNLFQISLYIPSGDSSIDATLSSGASLVFGPSMFQDPTNLALTTNIQQVRGWQTPWTQLSEFDLRMNSPIGQTQVWAWTTDPSTQSIQGILLNHNPTISETGYTTLDTVLSGQPSTHNITYVPPSSGNTTALGQDSTSQHVWIRCVLSSSRPETGPLLSSLQVSVN